MRGPHRFLRAWRCSWRSSLRSRSCSGPAARRVSGQPGGQRHHSGHLCAGIVYIFRQVMLLEPASDWIDDFRERLANRDLTAPPGPAPRLLAPMARMLSSRQSGRVSLSATSLQTLLDGIAARLDETRETSRYLIGTLVFLGLLGTFYGLLETVRSVGDVIGALNVGGERHRARLRRSEIRAGIAAARHVDRVQHLAVRAGRQPRARLSRSAGRAGAEPLLQRSRRVAVDLYAAVARAVRRGRRRLDAGLSARPAGADRRQHGKPAADHRAQRGGPDRSQYDAGRPERPARDRSANT